MKPKKPTAKQKPVKAKRYWKTASGTLLYPTKKQAEYFSGLNAHTVQPVAVIPCDKASLERMAEQIAKAIMPSVYDTCAIDAAQAGLASIGIAGGKAK